MEKRGHDPEEVALFLMRCLFTMFAEDVELLPRDSFKDLLAKCAREPQKFAPMVEQLWRAMDKGEFAYAIERQVKRFNGHLFRDAKVLPLQREEIGELLIAAKHNWKEVEPAIFGTLLEQALDEKERARLGAHYTPRAYVERLVVVTVIEPLRQEWAQVQATAERLNEEGKDKDAIAVVREFHRKLCRTRVLDPACGTGNFLYVSMELMKRLEGEVLEALVDLGGQETLALDRETVDPHQFLGLEINPRAAALAELVIWLGYLQWHFRTKGAPPSEPILRDFQNVRVMDAVLTWDGWPLPKVVTIDGKRGETFPNARRPDWPEAEFIVGNPPFIGKGEPMREALGQSYLDALAQVYPQIGGSADYVMYWWSRAAELLSKGKASRFGLVTTNSITQIFNRRVVAAHLEAKSPISLIMAIPDHPWRKRPRRGAGSQINAEDERYAAVRIAMTVGVRGKCEGTVRRVIREDELDTDSPSIEFSVSYGRVNSDLTIGVDLTKALPLNANEGLASMGPALGGRGFVLRADTAQYLAKADSGDWLRKLTTGRDITARHRNRYVIDVRKYETEDHLRRALPHVYQHLKETVYPGRQHNRDARLRSFWWRYRRSNETYFSAISSLRRYIATVETTKHRVFVFVNGDELLEHGVVGVGLGDAFYLGVLSSRVHVCWTLANGGTLESRPRYNKDVCFDPFPFPDCSDDLKDRIRAIAEELDAHRKARQSEHPRLTLTQMYNVLEKLRSGEPLNINDERIKGDGLVLVLKDLHECLDELVFEAYGWPVDLDEEEVLARLVALNKERAAEEKAGKIRWLRPEYQIPRFGSEAERARLEEERRRAREEARLEARQGSLDLEDDLQEMKPRYPTGDELGETAAVMRVLATAEEPLSIAAICGHFSQGRQVEKRVALTVLALARLGHLTSTDGGDTFSLRRVA